MNANEKPQFCAVMLPLFAMFGKDAEEAVLESYWLGLRDLPLESVRIAVARSLQECEYMPRARRLRAFTGILAASERSAEAFDVLTAAMRHHGAYASVQFDDPAITATVRELGGWTALCRQHEAAFNTKTRARFETLYAEFRSSGVSAEQGRALAGLATDQASLCVAQISCGLLGTGRPTLRLEASSSERQ